MSLGDCDGEERFTTKQVLEEEIRMWRALERLGNRPGLQASEKNLSKQLQKRPTIRKEQANFVRHLTQYDSSVRIGLGLAGTGKTYALKTFVDTMKQHGYRILGAAPTGQAAEVLGREIGIECQTLTKFLGDYRFSFSTGSPTMPGNCGTPHAEDTLVPSSSLPQRQSLQTRSSWWTKLE